MLTESRMSEDSEKSINYFPMVSSRRVDRSDEDGKVDPQIKSE